MSQYKPVHRLIVLAFSLELNKSYLETKCFGVALVDPIDFVAGNGKVLSNDKENE